MPEYDETARTPDDVTDAEAAEIDASAEAATVPTTAVATVDVDATDGEEGDPVEQLRAALRFAPGDWFVVHSYAGYENKVKTNLETRITSLDMEDFIYQVEVPTREEVEVKNQGEGLVYQTERFLAENGDKVSPDVRGDVEEKLGALRAVVGGNDIAAIRNAVDELAKASSAMGSAMYADQAAAGAAGSGDSGPAQEDVVDAEIVDEDK